MKKTISRTARQNAITYGIVLVFFAVMQPLAMTGKLSSSLSGLLIPFCYYVVLAVSLNLTVGILGELSLGHAGFMCVGAFASAFFSKCVQGTITNSLVRFLLALLIGSAFAALFGILIGIPVLRLRGDYLAIATLGLGEIIRVVIMNIDYVGGAAGFKGIPHHTNFAWVFFLMVFALFFIKNFVNSNHGRACLAIRENEIAAESMGVNTTKFKVIAFTIGAAFAGVAGGLFAHCFYLVSPNSFTFMQSFNYLIMVVMGGLGSITGSIAGAFVVTFISAALASWPEFRMIIYALALILLMFYRPQGLFGYMEVTNMGIFRKIFKKGGRN